VSAKGFRKGVVAQLIREAIAGGLKPGEFAVDIKPEGGYRILPAVPLAADADPLDSELDAWRASHGGTNGH